jgi:hypothetical protein
LALKFFMFLLHKNWEKCYNKERSGYIILVSILVVGAVGLAITLSLLLLSVDSARTSLALEQTSQARGLANACVEEALEQIRANSLFTGSGNLSLGQGTCGYTVTSQTGQNRTVIASGTVDTVVRKSKIIINNLNPTLTITSWQELADF